MGIEGAKFEVVDIKEVPEAVKEPTLYSTLKELGPKEAVKFPADAVSFRGINGIVGGMGYKIGRRFTVKCHDGFFWISRTGETAPAAERKATRTKPTRTKRGAKGITLTRMPYPPILKFLTEMIKAHGNVIIPKRLFKTQCTKDSFVYNSRKCGFKVHGTRRKSRKLVVTK